MMKNYGRQVVQYRYKPRNGAAWHATEKMAA